MILIPSISIPPWIKRVVSWVFFPKGGLIILLGLLFVAFVTVMISQVAEGVIGQLLGLSGDDGIKNQILTFLGLSMGGVLLALQAVIANRRAEAMENAANAQAKANENTEQGQRQERLKDAIEHLGHSSDSVRLGGAYELFHLAHDIKEWRETILGILCAHIRQTTSESEYRKKHKSKPSEEIQSLLILLFVQEHEIFKDCHINLQGSWLNGVNLLGARLEKAVLIKAHLYEVNFFEADLREADLEGAYLYGANLVRAKLQKADLEEANLHQVDLINAHLQGASLFRAQLQRAILTNTQLQGADLSFAKLQCALLTGAQLQGATLCNAEFHEAELFGARLQGVTSQSNGSSSFETRIRDRIGEESDLLGIIFAGGLTENYLASLVKGLPDDSAATLHAILKPHVGKERIHELPKISRAVLGSYTEDEAEQWIEEYNDAMSEVPEEDNS